MKLKFLQSGGTFNPKYSVYEPYIVPEEEEESSSSKSSSKKSKEGSTNNEILKMIRESFSDGLPSDLRAASTTIANVFSNIERMIDNPDLYGSGSIASAYTKALPLLKSIEFNRKEYENIYESLTESGSMSEIAINSYGQLAVQTEEGFSWVTPEEYHENIEQYQPISNAQLLNLRANSPELAFQNNVFETLKNGTNVDTITKQILDYVSKIGNQEQVQKGYGYVPGGKLMQDFKEFSKTAKLEGFDPKKDDLYSYEISTKSERENAYLMIDIIYNMLPNTAKTLLKYKSNGTDEGAKGMITLLAGTASDHSVKYNIDLEGGYSKNSGSSSSSDNDKIYNQTIMGIMGLGQENEFNIVSGTTNGYTVIGNTIPIMKDSSSVIQNNLLSSVENSQLNQALQMTDISIAGQHIDSSASSKIYLSDKKATFVYLPYTKDNYGNIIPDYNLLYQKDQVDKYIKDNNLTFEKDYNKIMLWIKDQKDQNDQPFTINFDKQGKVIFDYIKRFALFDASFPNEIFPDEKIKNEKYVTKIEDEATAKSIYEKIKNQNQWKNWDYDVTGIWHKYMYKGTVAIPVNENFIISTTQNLDAKTVSELMERDKQMKANNDWNYADE